MDDCGEAEHVEGDVEIEVRNPAPAGALAIGGDIVFFGRDVEGGKIDPSQTGGEAGGHPVHHQMIAEIGERMAERGKLPVEDGEHPRLAGMRSEEHTSELQSLMRNSYAVF